MIVENESSQSQRFKMLVIGCEARAVHGRWSGGTMWRLLSINTANTIYNQGNSGLEAASFSRTIIINGLMGLVFTIILLYCLGDLNVLLESATGFPFVQLYYNVTQNHGAATILTLFHAFIAVAANSAGLTSTSRTAWAFARDRAFPFSSYYSHLHVKNSLPIRMCILLTVLQFLLGLIYIGNTTAFNAVISMSVVGMYLSYVLPITFMLFYGRKDPSKHRPKYFSMGRWGSTVNVLALIWGAVAMIFSMFPSYQPVNAQNMNYASLVLGGWIIGGGVYYFTHQRKVYQGPVDLL